MYKNTANSHTEYGRLIMRHCYTERNKSTLSYSLSSLQNTHQTQKQQRCHIHINNSPSLPQESLQHFRFHSCLKMRTEDQLHCLTLTTPFRGTTTVLEVVTPNPLVSNKKKKKKVSLCTVLYRLGVLGSSWIFIRPRRSHGFTDKMIISWSGSLSLFEWHRWRKEANAEKSFVYFVIKMSELLNGR